VRPIEAGVRHVGTLFDSSLGLKRSVEVYAVDRKDNEATSNPCLHMKFGKTRHRGPTPARQRQPDGEQWKIL